MINPDKLHPELVFQTARSGGSGGQNVNKVETKVELRFDIPNSALLTEEEKKMLIDKLSNKLTNENILILNCDEDRSQLKNKDIVTKRFLDIITKALIVPKIRKATKVPKSVIKKRLKDKKSLSEIKQSRRKPGFE